jgi:hypothetical protein
LNLKNIIFNSETLKQKQSYSTELHNQVSKLNTALVVNDTAHYLNVSLDTEGAAEKVLEFFMQLMPIHNNYFCSEQEQIHFLKTSENLEN